MSLKFLIAPAWLMLAVSLIPSFTRAQQVAFVDTEVLRIGYEAHGPESAYPVILLHGFPYDVRSFDGVIPPLTAAGYRVLLPYLRGYGPTRFRDPAAPRMAQQSALAQDLLDFADALGSGKLRRSGFRLGQSRRQYRRHPVAGAG